MEDSFRYAKICADYLAEECNKNAQFLDTTHYTRFHSSGIPNITLQDYFRRIAKYSHCSGECFVIALRYIQRYCDAAQSALTFRNAHRLVVVATMIAAKLRDDVFYDNKYYSNIGGINGKEMNELELDMLVTMGWYTWVDKEEFDQVYAHAKRISAMREQQGTGENDGVVAAAANPAAVPPQQQPQNGNGHQPQPQQQQGNGNGSYQNVQKPQQHDQQKQQQYYQ